MLKLESTIAKYKKQAKLYNLYNNLLLNKYLNNILLLNKLILLIKLQEEDYKYIKKSYHIYLIKLIYIIFKICLLLRITYINLKNAIKDFY